MSTNLTKFKVILSKKKFKQQDSLLTCLLRENVHIRSLYNIIIAIVSVLVITTIGDYVTNTERFKTDFAILYWNLRDVYPHFVFVWLVMNATLVLVHYPLVCLRHYIQCRMLLKWLNLQVEEEKSSKKTDCKTSNDGGNIGRQPMVDIIDELCSDDGDGGGGGETIQQASKLPNWMNVTFVIVHIVIVTLGVASFSSWYILQHKLTISVSFALTMEMARLMMKAHSFFIERQTFTCTSATKVLKKSRQNNSIKFLYDNSYPRLSSFLYYLFAPTLIYRDHYPRNPAIRWRMVVVHSIQMLLVIFASFVAINRCLVDLYSNTGEQTFVWSQFFRNLSLLFLLGVALEMLCFYGLLHLWHNITAELMRFADRRFYDEWWQSASPGEYYRKWNLLVQDWLYAYIYVPVFNHTGGNRSLAIYSVIFVSGVAHEYIIGFSVGFFFPLLFITFSIGGHIYFIATRNLKHSNMHNTLFLLSNMLGWGLISVFYSVEWYSRSNCPLQNATFTDELIPRLVSCVKMSK